MVLLSGGMDSCVTAAMARRTHELALLHASYSQRTERRERQAFDEIADFYSVTQRLAVQLDHFAQIGGSALTDKRIAALCSSAPLRRTVRVTRTAGQNITGCSSSWCARERVRRRESKSSHP